MILVCHQGWQSLLYDPVDPLVTCWLAPQFQVGAPQKFPPSWGPQRCLQSSLPSWRPAAYPHSRFWVARPLPTAPSPSPRAMMPGAFVLSQQECDPKPIHSQSQSLVLELHFGHRTHVTCPALLLSIPPPPRVISKLYSQENPGLFPYSGLSSCSAQSRGPRALSTGVIFPKGWGSLQGVAAVPCQTLGFHGNLFEVRDHSWFIFYSL